MHVSATSAKWGDNFVQTADIDLAGCTWAPIGNSTTKFTGAYDGGEFTISNLTYTAPSGSDNSGLFGYTDGASLSDLTLVDPTISSNDEFVGALVGVAIDTDIERIVVEGADVAGDGSVGGVVGELQGSGNFTFTGVVASGAVNSSDGLAGGLIGYAWSNGGTVRIEDSSSSADVVNAGDSGAGGLIGQLESNGSDVVTVVGSSATGSVTTDNNGDMVGGLIGYALASGGSSLTVTESYTMESVIEASSYHAGGLIGYAQGNGGSITVSKSFASGSITASVNSPDYYGGLIGTVTAPSGSGSSVAVSDTSAYVSIAPASGSGLSINEVGGLIGSMDAGVTVEDSFSTGVPDVGVSGSPQGGLVASSSGTVTDSFWDTDTSGLSTSAAGTGKTTAEMQSFSTFDTAGWSIADGAIDPQKVWVICADFYPIHSWIAAELPFCAPDAPSGVTVSGEGGVASVSWSAASVVGSAAVSSYTVTADPGGASCTATAPAVTCDVSGLTVGTSYTFSVTATNAVGTGPAGVSAAFVMPAAATTTTPTTAAPTTTAAPAVAPAPVRDAEGNLPSVSDPSKATMVVNGVVSFLDVVVEDESRLVVSGDGFEMALAGSNPSGESTRAGDSGRLEVTDGGLLQVSGTGFDPGSVVEIFVMSDPVFAGTVTVGSDGTFAGSVPVPEGLVVGPHTVQANGVTADGVPRSLNLGIELVESAVLPATGGGWSAVPLVLIGVGALGLLARRRTI